MTFKLLINGKPSGVHSDIQSARNAAKAANDHEPTNEVSIIENQNLQELWVGPCTFTPAGTDVMIAYSEADLDSIGAITKCGTVWSAGSRGVDVGAYLSLYDAAVGLHEHASSPAYVAA